MLCTAELVGTVTIQESVGGFTSPITGVENMAER